LAPVFLKQLVVVNTPIQLGTVVSEDTVEEAVGLRQVGAFIRYGDGRFGRRLFSEGGVSAAARYLEGSMDKMKEEIIKQYEELMGKDAKLAETPGYPGKILEKSEPNAPAMMQTEYRIIVGKLQYYQTKIGPATSNSVRELSTHLQHPTEEH
jgi:hypothetical protein